jgi:hypothetical protein
MYWGAAYASTRNGDRRNQIQLKDKIFHTKSLYLNLTQHNLTQRNST